MPMSKLLNAKPAMPLSQRARSAPARSLGATLPMRLALVYANGATSEAVAAGSWSRSIRR